MEAHPKFVWFDGAVVPWEQANVHVSTATVLRGANVFEGVRAYWNADERELFIFRNDEHMARLRNSAKIMRMAVPWTKDELTRAQVEVLRANAFEGTVWFRLSLYVGEGEDHIWPPEQVPVGALITPPVTANILESITRATVLELARDALKLKVEEREIDRTELYVADEGFFCGSGWEITPVKSVDRYAVGTGQPGPLTRRLQEVYFSVVEGRVPQYRPWLLPVYGEAKPAKAPKAAKERTGASTR